MTKIFTSDSGEKFELSYVIDTDGCLAIHPVKEESKWEVGELILMENSRDYTFFVTFPANRDQARLIKEAVEALMEYITGSDMDASSPSWFTIEADRARQSIMEDK